MTTRNKITSSIIKAAFALLLAASPVFAMQGHGIRAVERLAFAAVASRDVIVYQGQAVSELLAATGLETSGRGLRAHIRNATPAATVIQFLTYNGAANARVAFDGSAGVRMTIGAGVSALWLVGADRVEWVYDVESYSLSDDDDVLVLFRGKFVVYGNRTRESDVTPSAQMPSGDGRYVRFDTDAQGLSDAQKLAARTNIGAGTGGGGGSGDVVGPASVTDDRIAAFDTTSGKLIKQGSVTATAVASHLSNTSNPHSVTAAQAGADPAGTAASAVSTHAALTETHGISTYGASLVNDADAATARGTLGLGTAATAATGDFEAAGSTATHAAVTSSVHGITAAGAALIDDADAAAQRTTLGLGTAATQASSAFEPAGAISTHNAVTTAHGISAFGATLADDADAATARTTLGLGTAATTAATDYATAAQGTDDRTASGLRTASTVVSVSAATAPTSGQVLTATSTTAATWQTPSAGGSPGGSSGQPQYNNAGAFGGMTGVAWDNALQKVTYTGAGVSGLAVIRIVGGSGTSSTRINDNGTVIIDADVSTGTTPLTVKYNGSNVATISYQGLIAGVDFGTTGVTNKYTFGGGTALVGLSASAGFYLRYGTTAQKVLVSGTYTDASNYVRASLAATSTAVTLAAETAGTGADNVPVILTPAGTSQVEVGNGVQFTEMTAPSAPAANKVILFAQDNGAGKTQLMALFPSGAAQVVATEP